MADPPRIALRKIAHALGPGDDPRPIYPVGSAYTFCIPGWGYGVLRVAQHPTRVGQLKLGDLTVLTHIYAVRYRDLPEAFPRRPVGLLLPPNAINVGLWTGGYMRPIQCDLPWTGDGIEYRFWDSVRREVRGIDGKRIVSPKGLRLGWAYVKAQLRGDVYQSPSQRRETDADWGYLTITGVADYVLPASDRLGLEAKEPEPPSA